MNKYISTSLPSWRWECISLMPPLFKPFLTLSFCWTCCTCWSQAWSHCSFHPKEHSCLHFRSPWHILSWRSLLYVSCISMATTLHLFSRKSNEKSQPLQPQPLLHFTVMDKKCKQILSSQQSVQNVFQHLTREVLLGVSRQMECSQSSTQGAWGP